MPYLEPAQPARLFAVGGEQVHVRGWPDKVKCMTGNGARAHGCGKRSQRLTCERGDGWTGATQVPRRPGGQGDDVTSALVEDRVLVGGEVHASVDPVRGGGCEGLGGVGGRRRTEWRRKSAGAQENVARRSRLRRTQPRFGSNLGDSHGVCCAQLSVAQAVPRAHILVVFWARA